MLVHGVCIDLDGAGVLLRGAPGSGKSDLALRLIHDGKARLVADDQVELTASGGRLHASAPEALAGMLEVRGVGLVRCEHLRRTEIMMVVDLCDADRTERLPEPAHVELLGRSLPLFRLCAHQPSAAAKVAAALDMIRGTT